MAEPSQAFPIGGTLDEGAFEITERLAGERWRGRYRGIGRGGEHVLVTCGGRQERPAAERHAALTWAIPGIARLRHIGEIDGDPQARYFQAMVEDEPAGHPLSGAVLPLAPGAAVALACQVGDVLLAAEAGGVLLGELMPELIYVAADDGGWRLTGIAPRAPAFLRGATRPNFGLPAIFAEPCQAPEVLANGAAGPTSNSFVVALLLSHWLTGTFPYAGADPGTRAMSLLAGLRSSARAPAPVATAIEPALEPDPARRPALAELLASLR